MDWKRYWTWLIRTTVGLTVFIVGAIWVVDPYGNLPFSPPLDRTAMATNQRFSYPMVARDARFDSVVFGTSTARLLNPKDLDAALGGRFANLSMNSAQAYEQARLFEVFARNHPAPRTVIIGIDVVWCNVEDTFTKYTFRRFPEWMYDANPWNDVPEMLEFKTLETLGKQVGSMIGLKETKYGHNGYANFLPPLSEYDLEKARGHIYGKVPRPASPIPPASNYVADAKTRAGWTFATHTLLADMLAALPEETRKILLFVPYHSFTQAARGTPAGEQWQECRNRIVAMASKTPNATVQDFMIPSPITTEDSHYWDRLHFTAEVSHEIVRLIGRATSNQPAPNGEYVILEEM